MTTHRLVKPRTSGGAGDEVGGHYRRAVAALFAAHSLNGSPFPGLPFGDDSACVETVAVETDDPIDDVVVGFRGGRVYIQAKRTLRGGRPLDEVAKQWLSAVRQTELTGRDYIAAAAGSLSRTIEGLKVALHRAREGARTFDTQQTKGLEALRSSLIGLGAKPEEMDRVISRALVLKLEVEELEDEQAARAQLLLDRHVVLAGQGLRAWRELCEIAGSAARFRIEHSTGGWLDELRKRGVPLTQDMEASRAAYLEARYQALVRYREAVTDRGSHVDLTGIGFALPRIPLADMDADIDARDPANTETGQQLDLLWGLRRRGRVILTGLPGGGKTTALWATASKWAMRLHWSVPIVVSLGRLAEKERFRKRPLREDILDLATEDVNADERSLVQGGLAAALRDGDAILLLDGLDEAAVRRLELTGEIAKFLREIHSATDVLLTTREVGYADAHQVLGFRDLSLNAPQHADRSVEAILRAVAAARRLDQPDRWSKVRHEWVMQTLASDRQLSETPFLPILLALLAADSDTEALPKTRAQILADVLHDIVRRYEIKRGREFAALPVGHEADALIGAFPIIAQCLATAEGSAPRRTLEHAIASYLHSDWALAPGPAQATAREIAIFWDECGIFVARGRELMTMPRIRIFLEIGAALDAASRPAQEAAAWVEAAAQRDDGDETLVLAAGLSQAVSEALIERACRSSDEREDHLALVASAALSQGGKTSQYHLRALVLRLVRMMTPADGKAWRAATSLLRLRVPDELQEQVLRALDSFPRSYSTVGRALAALNWDWGDARRNPALETALRVSDLPRLVRQRSSRDPNESLAALIPDQSLMHVKERAAELLLPGRPQFAPLIVKATEHASMRTVDNLADILRQNGHDDLARTLQARRLLSDSQPDLTMRWYRAFNEDIGRTVDAVASLAEPAALDTVQRRRLAELASFLDTIDFNRHGTWSTGSWLDKLRKDWYALIAALGDFDLAVIAAEAAVVQYELATEPDHDPLFSLLWVNKPARLTRWDLVPNQAQGRELAILMLAAPRMTSVIAARALAAYPDRAGTALLIERIIANLPRDSKQPAVRAYLSVVSDWRVAAKQLAGDDDEAIREAIASIVPLTRLGQPTYFGARLAMDAARGTQLAALEQFRNVKKPTSELVGLVESGHVPSSGVRG